MSYVPNDGTKMCRRCDTEKSVHEFRIFQINGDPDRAYRRSWCQDCEAKFSREWRKRHPGYHAAKSRGYRQLRAARR